MGAIRAAMGAAGRDTPAQGKCLAYGLDRHENKVRTVAPKVKRYESVTLSD